VEQVKKWRIIPQSLGLEREELTPTMKVRRHKVYQNYEELIESMYLEDLNNSE